ncbi:SLC13 family permease [Vicingaceae bacterium]|nr:SLC13 family permease [Vicingaceae bacterium]MDB4060981.1 SLC13 family permease [Vicingaceae bacterium]
MLTTPVILLIATIVFLLSALYLEWFKPTVSFFIAILVFIFGGILTPSEALNGFANEQLAVIVLLLIISDIFKKSSVVNFLFHRLFGRSESINSFKLGMMTVVASFSAFFNNTPLVAMMTPYTNNWAIKNKVAPSKLLIPLSYAAILGGCVTLVGTSTNLIVNGLAIDAGFESLSIFDFATVGLPMMVIGIIYLLAFGNKLLPDTRSNKVVGNKGNREFFVETQIKANSKLINQTVESSGFRALKGLYLVEVVRNNLSFSPVAPDFVLRKDDALFFAGETKALEEIKEGSLGLTLPKIVDRLLGEKSSTNEVVVSFNSFLIGKKVKESDFRARFDAAIVAIHRNGERLSGKIGDMELKAGDVLLVFSGSNFISRAKNNRSFYILSHTEEPDDINVKKVSLVFSALVFSVILSVSSSVSLLLCLACVLLLGILLKIMPLNEIRKGLDFDLIILIAFGLAFGKAMINSGASIYLAGGFLLLQNYLSPTLFLMLIFIITNILAAYITNKAAVAILFPISVSIAMQLGVNPIPFILIVSFGAAANFITPIGYQTNLMVYGSGGYNFKDFMKIGWPLTLIYMVVSAVILAAVYL